MMTHRPHLIPLRRIILALGIMLSASAMSEDAKTPAQPIAQPTQAQSLSTLLQQRGWTTWRDRDGSIWFAPIAKNSCASKSMSEPVEAPTARPAPRIQQPSQAAVFIKSLEQRGWKSWHDKDGSTWLIPAGMQPQTPSEGKAEKPAALEQTSPTPEKQPQAPEEEKPQALKKADDPTGQVEAPQSSRVVRLLEQRGWRHWHDADGSLWLSPIQPSANTPPPPGSRPAKRPYGQLADSDNTGMQDMDRRLAAHGWRVERDHDGGLLLFPGTLGS